MNYYHFQMALGRGSWFGISSFIFSRASTAEGSTTSWLGVGFRIAAALFQTCNQAHHEEGWKWWCFPKHSRSSIYADARIWVPWQDILTTPQKTTGKVCVQNSWQNVVWLWKTLKAICFVWKFSDFDLAKMCWNFWSIHWMFYLKLLE